MKHFSLFTLLLAGILLSTADCSATIRRVNNNGFGAAYASLQAVNDDVNVPAGDTVHLEGSNTDYYPPTITKKLIIIGPGYFLNENPKVSNSGLSATIPYITFNGSAAGSQLIGVTVANSSSGITIYASNITIRRCRIQAAVYLYFGISNISILQNFFFVVNANTNNVVSITSSGFPSGVYFNNNIVQRPMIVNSNAAYTFTECKNNVFDIQNPVTPYSIELYATNFRNNIVVNPSAVVKVNGITNFTTTPSPAVTHNVSSSASVQFGTANNNIVVTTMSTTLFVPAASNSSDGKYQLLASSPASSNGSDGTDRGAFGGAGVTNRYTLSGVPSIPLIYEISTTGAASPSTGLPVTIKSRIVQ